MPLLGKFNILMLIHSILKNTERHREGAANIFLDRLLFKVYILSLKPFRLTALKQIKDKYSDDGIDFPASYEDIEK